MSTSRIKHYQVSQSQYNYIQSITKGLSRAEYKLFCHIFASTLSHYRQLKENSDGWIAITKRFIQDKFRTAVPERLRELELLDIDRAYSAGLYPRSYKIKTWVLAGYIDASVLKSDEHEMFLNLVTGKPFIVENILTNVEIPDLIKKAIERFQASYFDRKKVIEHLKYLEQAYKDNPTESNQFRYWNDWFVFDAIDKLSYPLSSLSALYAFKPLYTLQSTGRIGTPLQSCSRAMKQAAYSSIPDIFNYDLTSSQIALSLDELNKRAIRCRWLEEYLNDKAKRYEYAQYVGVPVAVWKECLCTVLMTGHVPTNIKWRDSPIVETLSEEIETEQELEQALARLREILRPLIKPLKQWHGEVEKEAASSGQITNKLGITRSYVDFKKNKKSGLIAHLLQGMEAHFIHTLTLLADKYGFEPIGNEHDGIITIGPIPPVAIMEAKKLTGLNCLELREKPFGLVQEQSPNY